MQSPEFFEGQISHDFQQILQSEVLVGGASGQMSAAHPEHEGKEDLPPTGPGCTQGHGCDIPAPATGPGCTADHGCQLPTGPGCTRDHGCEHRTGPGCTAEHGCNEPNTGNPCTGERCDLNTGNPCTGGKCDLNTGNPCTKRHECPQDPRQASSFQSQVEGWSEPPVF